jgi:2-methylcitrate dehydratase PrpD
MMGDGSDLVHVLAEYAAKLRYENVTEEARDRAKQSILDTLGVSLAGAGLEPAVGAVFDIVRETGGEPQCTLLGFGGRAPALMAAFANGALVHALDYDDQTPWGQHCGSTIVPAVFALAERQGGVAGKDMIAAVAAGQDIFARLLRNVGWRKDWNFSTVAGVYAGTVASARVIGLSAERTSAALGIATMQSSGLMEMVAGRGSDLRGLYAGFSAKGAVLAALMAERGVTGIDRAFEGPNGVMACYFGGEYDRAAILEGLGREFMGAATLYKRWPCVGTSHSHMKAALDIVGENNLAADDIVEIRLHVGDYHRLMSEPLKERCAPATFADAKFSLPFLVATAIVRGGMSAHDFSQASLRDEAIIACARKTSLVFDSALDWGRDLPPGRVEILAADGRHWLREGRGVPGNFDNLMGWDDIRAKFRECAAAAPNPLSPERLDLAERYARELENLADATVLIRCLA